MSDNETPPAHKRYSSDASPFLFKRSKLQEVRLEKLIPFLRSCKSLRIHELDLLLAGARTWIICPTETIGTKHQKLPKRLSLEMVQGAMSFTSLRSLTNLLNVTWKSKLKRPDWREDGFLDDIRLHRFSWGTFFMTGATDPKLPKLSTIEFNQQVENQYGLVCNAAAVLFQLHYNKENSHANSKRWGMNKVYEDAARLLPFDKKSADGKRRSKKNNPSGGGIKDHWELMIPSAPLIYAACLLDNSSIRHVLNFNDQGDSPLDNCDDSESLANALERWFSIADAVEDTLISPNMRKSENAWKWKLLAPDRKERLPACPSSSRFLEILGLKRGGH